MTSRDFAFWLQGFFEISDPQKLTAEQCNMIRKHLNLVFIHEIDPSMGDENHQHELNKIHNEYSIPNTENEAILKWGPKPSPQHVFGIHGWYNPAEGVPRC